MKRARINKQKGGPVLKEAVQVFCRVRPHPGPQASTNETACLRIVPPCHIHLLPPSSANRNVPSKELQYTFKHVFDETAAQKDIFEEVALPQIKNLLIGRNSLLFTYGVTGSGKTFTMTGTLQEGGIMPRCFDAIFDSISECQAKRSVFKPDKLNGFEIVPEGDADVEGDLQARIAVAKMHKLEKKNSDPDLAQRVRDQSYSLPIESENYYAVFITYIEIYNNCVYDLLEDIYEENARIRPMNTKIVREDSNHNMFVHGVNEIEVLSTDEAFEAYFYGQKRRRIAQTALNAESSRSHSVFTIRLVQAPANEFGCGLDQYKKHVTISQLSLVDLAGSERTNRTKNTGLRLKEAGNINNSLLTLRICLELLRENQNGANKVIPYRDSRLTHLFRNFFDGDGQVSMIICVSPLVEECEETVQVLKFAEMSQEVVTSVQTPLRPHGRGTPAARKRPHETYDLAVKEFKDDKRARGDFRTQSLPDLLENVPDARVVDFANEENVAEFKTKLEKLKFHMETVRSWDFTSLRNKVLKFERDTYYAVNQAKAMEQQCEFERERVSTLENRLLLSDKEQMKLKRKLDEAETALTKMKGDLAAKESLIKRKTTEQEKAKEEFSSKMVQAQEKLNREVERKLKSQRAAWESEMKYQEGRIRMARQVLSNEAKMDLPAYATPSRSRVPPSKSVESIPSSLKGVSVAGVKSSLFSGPSVSAVINTPNPQLNGIGNTPRPGARKGVPVVNRRYRRSRSVDNDVWLEHRPVHEVPTNTIMQPVMTKRKSVTQLTDSKDVTEKTNKYCLLTQNQDSDGDLETRLYKGDVIPTAGGGAQVTFNDVEVLKQVSPNGSPTRKTPMQIRQDLEAACAQSSESYRFPHPTRTHARRPHD